MSSSDSDDDCYGNIAQRLQSMKNKFHEDKLDSTNLLNDSETPHKIAIQTNISHVEDAEVTLNTSVNSTDNELTLDAIIANSKRRVTRSSKKIPVSQALPKRGARGKRGRGRGRGRKSTATAEIEVDPIAQPECQEPRRAGRSNTRSHSRGRRSRGNITTAWLSPDIPTYSVGNTDEYPDFSDGQAMFTSKPEDIVVIEENDPLDDNEELSVKVYWQSSEFFKFTIRRYQKLAQIFDYFSNKENVSPDKLLFTYNEKILKIDDTPDSIDYQIVKFIDGGVTNNSVSQIVTSDRKLKDGIKIKFQCLNVRKPFETVIRHDDKLSLAMTKCAEELEVPLKKLKFLFDGDTLAGSSTPRQLELEGGECIDVKIMS